jgi:nucleoside-diphosphate-sugar epimerase
MAIAGLVLITGATGRVGSALLDKLSGADVDLRVLSHDESKAQSLRNEALRSFKVTSVACVVPLGKPVHQPRRLSRLDVAGLTRIEHWHGGPLTPGRT